MNLSAENNSSLDLGREIVHEVIRMNVEPVTAVFRVSLLDKALQFAARGRDALISYRRLQRRAQV